MTSTTPIVIECDGGSRGNPGPGGYAARILVNGVETALVAARLPGPVTNNEAEYWGLIEGLTLATYHARDSEILVRTDSKLVVEQMSGRWQRKNPKLAALASMAEGLIRVGRLDVTFEWVPRAQTLRVDKLYNAIMDRSDGSW